MDTLRRLQYAGIVASVLCVALTLSPTESSAYDANGTASIMTTTPTAVPAIPQNITFGNYVVIPHATDTATIVVSNTGVVTPDPGVLGDARMIPVSATAQPLLFTLEDAMTGMPMSFRIGAPGAGVGQITGPSITLASAAPGTGTFSLTEWSCAVDASATPPGAFASWDPALGTAIITPADDGGGGAFDGGAGVRCGARLTTVAGTDPYTGATYQGDVRIVVNY